jgi:uncharacterized membrane protein YkoI
MNQTLAVVVLAAAACAPRPADTPADGQAAPATMTLRDCVNAVQAVHAGTMVKVEGKTEGGRQALEFDVRSPDGTQWDIECDPVTGKVIETEQEVNSADQEPFKANVKVSEAEARRTALATHPGEIAEVEYEVEANGDASYEFDINPRGGGDQFKVEVDAATGKLVEDHIEHFQIGVE